MIDPEQIYLAPECCADPYEGRMWCEDDVWSCEDGQQPTCYVRADIVADLQTKLAAAEEELTRFRNGYKGSCYACETVGEKNEELETKLAAAEDDAARYRWLRHQHWSDDTLCVVAHPKRAIKLGESCPYGSMLDAAIDAATQKEES